MVLSSQIKTVKTMVILMNAVTALLYITNPVKEEQFLKEYNRDRHTVIRLVNMLFTSSISEGTSKIYN